MSRAEGWAGTSLCPHPQGDEAGGCAAGVLTVAEWQQPTGSPRAPGQSPARVTHRLPSFIPQRTISPLLLHPSVQHSAWGRFNFRNTCQGAASSSQVVRAESSLKGSKAAECGVPFTPRLGLGNAPAPRDGLVERDRQYTRAACTVTLSQSLTASPVGDAAQESPDVMDGLPCAWQGNRGSPRSRAPGTPQPRWPGYAPCTEAGFQQPQVEETLRGRGNRVDVAAGLPSAVA